MRSEICNGGGRQEKPVAAASTPSNNVPTLQGAAGEGNHSGTLMKENPTPCPASTKPKKEEDPYRIPVHLNIACTKCDGACCQLLQHRRSLNEVLRDIGLEICEDTTCDDGIRIAVVEDNGRGYAFNSLHASHITALNIVQFLLTEHGCITAVEVNRIMRHHESLLKALRLNGTVESVLISGMDAKRTPEDVAAFKVVKSISQLKRLTLDTSRCLPLCANMRLYGQLLRGATRQLRSLDVAAAEMSPKQAKRLIGALRRSKTVEHLVVGENVFTIGKQGSGRTFAEYLVNTDTLRTLRLTSKPDFTNENAIRTLVVALCQARTLLEVKVDLDLKMVGFAARVSLFAQVVAENTVLRRLRLPSVRCSCAHSWLNRVALDPPDPDSADKMVPWLGAVRKNTTLRELEIDLGGFGEPECRDFFEAVADNSALHSVVVRRLPTDCPMAGICETIRKRGIADRVLIRNHHVNPVDLSALPECPEVTGLVVSGRHFAGNSDQLCAAFKTLAQCSHVTSLSVHCWGFAKGMYDSLIACLRATKTLEQIEVRMVDIVDELTDEEQVDLDTQLIEAAASIPSLVDANFKGILKYSQNCAPFAGAVAAKRGRLTRLQITLAYQSNPAFAKLYTPQELAHSSIIKCKEGTNYKSELAAVQEVTARNSNNVSAAARYVLDQPDSDDGARVIEDLHDHPWLVRRVRRQAEVDVGEAKLKIARALKRVRSCSIDEYMRLAGVVKRRVESGQGEGRVDVHIADINLYCWLHIRSFLKVSDVVRA
ncbi:hypothetical protein MRX96_042537 [Rhipicephalus microplus]